MAFSKISTNTKVLDSDYTESLGDQYKICGELSLLEEIKRAKADDWDDKGSNYSESKVESIFQKNSIKAEKVTPIDIGRRSNNSLAVGIWEGVVTKVDKEGRMFGAELRDILHFKPERFCAEFEFKDVDEEQHELISENSVFCWYIYDHAKTTGSERGTNKVYFRENLPVWKNFSFDNITPKTNEYFEDIFDADTSM